MNDHKAWKHFIVKITFFALLLLCQAAFAYPPLPEARTETEALFVRRIIDFWRDKEYSFVKSQISAYLSEYPGNPFTEHFYAMLGDVALHEKEYGAALNAYERLTETALKEHVRTKRWQALYQLQRYSQLYEELKPLSLKGIEETFYFAEALSHLGFGEEALPLYKSLLFSKPFGAHAKLAMAEIYRQQGKLESAAELYLEIAEQHEESDEILFHAAVMLIPSDQEQAQALFKALARGRSRRAGDAAYQWMQLLANRGAWESIQNQRALWLTKIPEAHLATAYYYLGMIAYEQKQPAQAATDLQKSISNGIHSPHDQTALETLLSCADQLSDLDLCESSYTLLIKRYPEQKSEASMVRAAVYQHAGKIEHVLTLLEELVQQGDSHPIRELAGLQRIHLLIEMQKWEKAHQAIHGFMHFHPRSVRKTELLRLAVDLSQTMANENLLAQDLEQALSARVYEGEAYIEKQELLAKAYLKLNHVHAALGILHEMDTPDPLLFTQCYIKEGHSPNKVVRFGEKALKQYPEHDRLHLHLFNAYLQLSDQNSDQEMTRLAAEHLDSVIDIYPVSLENRLWLAHYFAKQQNKRAIHLLETLLLTDTNWKRFDKEGILLARLYQANGDFSKAIAVSEKVRELEQQTKAEAQLILGDIYREMGNNRRAESLLNPLERSTFLPIAQAASLNLARLHFFQEPEKSLKRLSEIKMRRSLASEPIHLEAALDHAELQTLFVPEAKRKEALLVALLEVKEEFTSCHDICSKDYHESRQLMPEKERIYQAYMHYLNACIYQLQGQTTEAHVLFSLLCQGENAVSRYIVERATTRLYDE
ncbi:MAG: hypothetical protein S4CHLAM2_03410 [Chlamydiales bacterium]|nr:hypothetical protein [Chlamydiales bacterium]